MAQSVSSLPPGENSLTVFLTSNLMRQAAKLSAGYADNIILVNLLPPRSLPEIIVELSNVRRARS